MVTPADLEGLSEDEADGVSLTLVPAFAGAVEDAVSVEDAVEDVVEEALEEAVKDDGEKAASAVFSTGSSVRQMSSRTFLMGTNIRRESLRAIRSLGFADW